MDAVLRPALNRPRGLPRLRALLENWLALLAEEIEAGCILMAGACEYDDRPGALHDALVAMVEGWKSELVRAIQAAQDEGHLDRAPMPADGVRDLRPDADAASGRAAAAIRRSVQRARASLWRG